MQKRVAIILAAGVSSRMKTTLPKVMHEVCGQPMLAYVLNACRDAGVDKMYVVVGYGSEQVKKQFTDCSDIVWVIQQQQKGTAHAVLCCKEHLKDFDGQTFVLCGDGPLIRSEVLKSLVKKYQVERLAAVLATAILEDATGYGRIVRDAQGNIEGIVEHNDCSAQQREIKEVNPSYYLFNNKLLFESLSEVKSDNAKGEYYLTDVLAILLSKGQKLEAVTAVRPEEAISVNDREQLSLVGKIMQRRINKGLMSSGVTIIDPDNTWIDARAQIGQDTIVEPFTCIQGRVKIGKDCRVGPFAYMADGAELAEGEVLQGFPQAGNSNKGVCR